MRVVLSLLVAATLGCWMSHREFADEDADATAPPHCPPAAPTTGPIRLTERWRHVDPGIWVDPGSAGLAITGLDEDAAGDTLLVAVPRGGGDLTVRPRLIRLDARSGALRSSPDEGVPGLGGSTAIAAVGLGDIAHPHGDLVEFVGAKPTEGADTVTFAGMLIDADGGEHDGWQRSDLGLYVGPGVARDLRASGFGIPLESQLLFLAVEMHGGASSPWSLHRLVVPWGDTGLDAGSLGDPITGMEDEGESHVAAVRHALPADPPAAFWGEPDAVTLLRLPSWTPPVRAALPAGPPATHRSSPVAAMDTGGGFAVFVAFRGMGAGTDPPAIRIENRTFTGGGLPVRRFSTLAEIEAEVNTPEPTALEASASGGAVLAWTARRTVPGGGSVPACLYLTPLADGVRPAGPSPRIDRDAAGGAVAPIDHVRVLPVSAATYAIWRQGTDLVVVRYDASS
jgi:hypothetical protein